MATKTSLEQLATVLVSEHTVCVLHLGMWSVELYFWLLALHIALLASVCCTLPCVSSSLPAPSSTPVVRDPNPQWRSACWSSQDTWLAVGNRSVSSTLRHACEHTKQYLSLCKVHIILTHTHKCSSPLPTFGTSHPRYFHNILSPTFTTPTIPPLPPSLLPQYLVSPPHSYLVHPALVSCLWLGRMGLS